jgi:acyl dehydratase
MIENDGPPETCRCRPRAAAAGDAPPPVSVSVSNSVFAAMTDATRDYFPGHTDEAYAKRTGQPDVFLNTMSLQGIVDRVALNWAGGCWFVSSRQMTMLRSVYRGDVLIAEATVTDRTPELPAAAEAVQLAVTARTASGLCLSAELEIRHASAMRRS